MNVHATNFSSSAIDSPGRRLAASSTGRLCLELLNSFLRYHIDTAHHLRDKTFLSDVLVYRVIRNAEGLSGLTRCNEVTRIWSIAIFGHGHSVEYRLFYVKLTILFAIIENDILKLI